MKYLLLLTVLLLNTCAFAQSGVITYMTTFNQHRIMPSDRPELKASMPEFIHAEALLFFTDTASLYKPVLPEQASVANGRGSIEFRRVQPLTHLQFTSHTQTRLQEYKKNLYAVHDTIVSPPWKMSPETKTILGYTCYKATYAHEQELYTVKTALKPDQNNQPTTEKTMHSLEIVAWYTKQLHPGSGPDKYHSLPGMILEVDINNGQERYVADKIELRPVTAEELRIPAGGKPLSAGAYKKMVVDDRARR